MNNRLSSTPRHAHFKSLALMPIVIAAALVAGCGDKPASGEKATQSAARVDGTEITVHQINQILQTQPNIKPEQVDAASKQILESLIDQQLAVNKAEEQKLDRDPKIMQALESSRRSILARAYLESVAATITPPTLEEVRKYYDEKTSLFKERKVYALQDFTIDVKGEAAKVLSQQLQATKTPNEFVEVLKVSGHKFNANQVTQPAENLPLALIDPLSKVGDGEGLYINNKDNLKVILVLASKSQPVTFEQAKPAIEQYLTAEKKRELLKNHIKTSREQAKIEYLGKFIDQTSPASTGASTSAENAPAPAPANSTPTNSIGNSLEGLNQDALNKGLSGLK